jgi:Dolichyl-phosphate-mannose-protein mannosyltransferase
MLTRDQSSHILVGNSVPRVSDPSTGQPRFELRLWLTFAAVTVTIILVAAIFWSFAHPYGVHWDEAQYLDDSGIDIQRLLGGHLLKLGGRILVKTGGRPPAHRLLALPVLALFGFHTFTARLVSLGCFGLSLWYIYRATAGIASRVAGAFAVLVFVLSPEVISASIFFGTEAPLYMSTSAMLYYIFACWRDGSEHTRNWIGLGLAVGLGFLSKASFAAIAIPVFVYWFAISRWGHFAVPRIASQRAAGVLALLIAAPWWVLNIKSSLAYAEYARGFVRNSLGQPSPLTWMRWINTALQGLLGHGVSILICAVLLTWLLRAVIRRETILDPLQKVALGACACAGVPIVLAQLSGTNHLLRHISPAVIPLAIFVGVLSDKTSWAYSWGSLVVSGMLFGGQLFMIVSPVVFPNKHTADLGFVNTALPWRVMSRFDQWDWRPVREISYSCGIANPKISFLGGGRAFDPPQIEYPWVVGDESTHYATLDFPVVTWLWRYEDGPLVWRKVMDSADESDIVMTAPHYGGELRYKENLDNQYNAEFADRLSWDPRFRGPIRVEMGRFDPIEIDLFLKTTLVCQAGEGVPAGVWSKK